MDQSEKTLRNKRVSLVRVLWRNSQIKEEMWEREAQIKEKYPHLFLKNVKYTKRGRFIIIQNVVIIPKKKRGERWGQNGINKRWDYKYPSLLSSMAG
jgi:hypothetical protein